MADPTSFVDVDASTIRQAEIPLANFTDGMNWGGSNSCGIGINIGGGSVSGKVEQFTLQDQFGNPRTPQNGQSIGGIALGVGQDGQGEQPILSGTMESNDGVITVVGNATLASLSTGWVAL